MTHVQKILWRARSLALVCVVAAGVSETPPLGAQTQPPAAAAQPVSATSTSVTLRQGEGAQATVLRLWFGARDEKDARADRNHFTLDVGGNYLAPDPVLHESGSPLCDSWDKTTFAYNTLVVDETSQAPAAGKCVASGRERGVDYVIADAGPVYRGVRFVRTAAMLAPQLVLFVDQIEADAPHTFDLVYHPAGKWEDLPEGTPWTPPQAPGYGHLTQAGIRTNAEDVLELNTRLPGGGRTRLTMAGGDTTSVITGYGILKSADDPCPAIILRRHTQKTVYIWAVTTDGSAVSLDVSPVHDSDDAALPTTEAVFIKADTGRRQWFLAVNPRKHDVTISLEKDLSWRTTKAFGARMPQ